MMVVDSQPGTLKTNARREPREAEAAPSGGHGEALLAIVSRFASTGKALRAMGMRDAHQEAPAGRTLDVAVGHHVHSRDAVARVLNCVWWQLNRP
jgi:hypothetical protein